jgi:predicted N-formylglutamate amidohydrolase
MTDFLQPGDPEPVGVESPEGSSPLVFVSDHAGRALPRSLGDLGVDEAERGRHVGWDIGVYGVTTVLARMLDAVYVSQPYSRLVIDCNRRPGSPGSIPAVSDGTRVPGNEHLSPGDRRAREHAILRPYHQEVRRVLAERRATALPVVLISMHSCTPRLRTARVDRPWEISAIADRDWRVGNALIALLQAETGLCVGRNQPYTVDAENDYTVPLHAEANGLPYVEIEIRQDLIEHEAGQRAWARLLAAVLPRAIAASGVLDERRRTA